MNMNEIKAICAKVHRTFEPVTCDNLTIAEASKIIVAIRKVQRLMEPISELEWKLIEPDEDGKIRSYTMSANILLNFKLEAVEAEQMRLIKKFI